jgi:hypothetical protein
MISKQAENTKSGFHYALRRTLVPWRFKPALDELLGFCREAEVDEVILKIDTEEFSHGLPPVKWVKDYQKNLFEAKKRLKDAGILYSLNPWVTVGHCDRGRRCDRAYPDMQWMTGHDGSQCTSQACPLSEGWRNWMTEVWTLYAETKPHVLWVEDDIRTFNHMPAEFGCFCDLHLERFSQLAGQPVDRKTLAAAITQPGDVHPWRVLWLDMMGQIMVETAAFISDIVHRASPETALGLMSSGVENHAAEGRRWDDFVKALKGKNDRFYSRAPLWAYQEGRLTELIRSAEAISQTRAVISTPAIEQTEVDNVPFSAYSKSLTYTFLQMAISAALGCEGATLNLFDHCGSPMGINPGVEFMLSHRRPFLNELSRAASNKDGLRGVGLITREKASYSKRLQAGEGFADLRPGQNVWGRVLNAFGFPTHYGESNVYALNGQSPYELSGEKIQGMLSKGVLLDGPAALALQDMGYGEYLGCEIKRLFKARTEYEIAAEELHCTRLGGGKDCFATANTAHMGDVPIDMAELIPGKEAETVASLVDPDRNRLLPTILIFENSLGGRVVVIAQDLEKVFGIGFLNYYRRLYMVKMLEWLSRGQLDSCVLGLADLLPVHMETEKHTLITVFNLSLDPEEDLILKVARKSRTLYDGNRLDEDGEWKEVECPPSEDEWQTILIKDPVNLDLPLALRIRWR